MYSKHPWLAVNLSMFFPGLGQIYAGHKWRGLILLTLQAILIAIALWSFFGATGNTILGVGCLLPIFIVHLANLSDAHTCVKKYLPTDIENGVSNDKDPWFAVFLARIIPGLGHLYIEKITPAVTFISLTIILATFSKIFPNLLLLFPIISAVACYDTYSSFPKRKQISKPYLIIIVTIAILVIRLVGSYLPTWLEDKYDIFEIPSKSMLPTLEVGDKIVVKKSRNYHPARGDLVVFKEPESAKRLDGDQQKKTTFFIKRIIGEPGQLVKVKDGNVYVNGLPLQEDYITEPPLYQWEPEPIPANDYLVLGDNRNNSFDSHVWGFLPNKYIVGKAYKIYFPPDRIRSLLNNP